MVVKGKSARRFLCLMFGASGTLALAFSDGVCAQQSVSTSSAETDQKTPPLTLRTRIALPGVYGRMDHYGWDSKRGILLVTALGNNTVEIVDQWKRVASITGLEYPQASLYCQASIALLCRANQASCGSTTPKVIRS